MIKGNCNCSVSTLKLMAEGDYINTGSLRFIPLNRDFPLIATYAPRRWAGENFWTDGTNVYYTNSEGNDCNYLGSSSKHFVLKDGEWEEASMNWDDLPFFSVMQGLWTDGTNIYHSFDGYGSDHEYIATNHFVLRDNQWVPKTWNGLKGFGKKNIWTDGTNIYYSYYSKQYILNKDTDTWEPKTWTGLTNFIGEYIWSDGTNIYYSYGADQYVLNGNTWEVKTWAGLSDFHGDSIWSDGTNIYIYVEATYLLDGDEWKSAPSSWSPPDLGGFISRYNLWSDGKAIYWSCGYSGKYDYIVLPTSAKLYAKDTGGWVQYG